MPVFTVLLSRILLGRTQTTMVSLELVFVSSIVIILQVNCRSCHKWKDLYVRAIRCCAWRKIENNLAIFHHANYINAFTHTCSAGQRHTNNKMCIKCIWSIHTNMFKHIHCVWQTHMYVVQYMQLFLHVLLLCFLLLFYYHFFIVFFFGGDGIFFFPLDTVAYSVRVLTFVNGL